MSNLNLNDLSRYGFAGAVFLLFCIAGFDQPQKILAEDYTNAAVVAALAGVALTVGSLLYALHRAFLYTWFYKVFAKRNGRPDTLLDLDITRWKNLAKPGTIQFRMNDWGAQVHFLYCASWAGVSSLSFGLLTPWKTTDFYVHLWVASVVLLVAAMLRHNEYQKWEKRVFEEDAKVVAPQIAAPPMTPTVS